MSNYTIVVLVAAALVVLAVVGLFATSRRRDRDNALGQLSRETKRRDAGARSVTAPAPVSGREYERSVALARSGTAVEPVTAKPPAVYVPPDPETLGVTRRQFLNRSIVGFMAFGLQGFGLAVIGFLWPSTSGGFGAEINVGSVQEVRNRIRANKGFLYVPEGRAWLTEYPADAVGKGTALYPAALHPMLEAGFTALWQTCPHLGCRVPECATSQWFECPCHGSQYNRNGEKKGGPAPRGMDRFPGSVDGSGNLLINTGQIIQGPPIGTNTTGQEAEGPHCIGLVGGGH
ncbi:MAG: ubiquinol-cytochrome c reductase iron-sulfur subunit [Acidimicrobiales bacterium]